MKRHGDITFSWKGDVFIEEIQGPFNEEGIEYYIPVLKEAILAKQMKTWNRLEIWDAEVLASPAVVDMAKEIYDWYDENGCNKTAIVVCTSLQVHIIKNMLKRSHAEVFSEVSEAHEWFDMEREPPIHS